jgi:hypothetical protein
LGLVTPDGWGDYLAAIAALGETRAGDDALERLVAAIVAQKAHAVAPCVLVSSSSSLALIRETSPADFLAISLGDLFDMPRGSQSLALAIRAEKIGAARAAMARLPASAVQYACETVGLFLSYVKPGLLGADLNLLAVYGVGADTDVAAPFASVPALWHFCGRLVQIMVRAIGQATLKPVDRLTAGDLARLRVHYRGDARFQSLRLARSELRGARAAAKRLSSSVPLVMGKKNRDALAYVGADLLADFGAALLLDTLDLSFASGAMGRALPVRLESEAQADLALARQSDLRALRDDAAQAGAMLDLCDLSALLVSGDLPDDFLPVVENESDLIALGLEFDSLSDAGDWFGADDLADPADDDGEAVLPDWLQAFAMDQAKPTAAKSAKPAKPSPHADALALAASFGLGAGDVPAPARRVIGGLAPAPVPVAPAPSGAVVRRVVRS